MLGERHIRTILEGALARSKADQTEVLLITEESALTRFANNTIHQNVAERNSTLQVRAVVGKKTAVASTNSLEAGPVREAVDDAVTIARFQADNPDFVSLPGPQAAAHVPAFAESTAGRTPEQRARAVQVVIRRAERDGLSAAGAYNTAAGELAVANSLGVFQYHASTAADVTAVVMGASGSGYADRAAADADEIDFEALAEEACGTAVRSANPQALEPGEYEVVLEPYAVAEMLDYLSYVGFGALQLQEGRSFMAAHMGQQVTAAAITIYDDGLDPACFPLPFDFEGVARQRIDLIHNGIASGVVYDSYTAQRAIGKKSTGHALPAPNTMGPLPSHLHLQPGDDSMDELIASVERGLWVKRFHYVNVLHPLETILTGMTRDGTFLVERGEVKHPVKNLRFSQSVLEALGSVEGIGRDTKLQRGWFGGTLVPALKLGKFSFTGATEF